MSGPLEEIKQHIKRNELRQAADRLESEARAVGKVAIEKNAITLQRDLTHCEQEEHGGRLTQDESHARKNQISQRLLELTEDLSKRATDDTCPGEPPADPPKRRRQLMLTVVAVMLLLGLGFAGISLMDESGPSKTHWPDAALNDRSDAALNDRSDAAPNDKPDAAPGDGAKFIIYVEAIEGAKVDWRLTDKLVAELEEQLSPYPVAVVETTNVNAIDESKPSLILSGWSKPPLSPHDKGVVVNIKFSFRNLPHVAPLTYDKRSELKGAVQHLGSFSLQANMANIVVLVAETATGAYLLHHEHLHHEYAAAAASLFDAALKRIETIKEDLEETNIKIKSAIPLSERTRDAWALRFLRGTANLLYHNPNLSLEDWDFLVGVSWEEARVENNRGVAQTALGHPKEALVSLKSALRKRGGNNRSVRNNLAVAYFIHEDYVHAVAEIREALSASEKNGTHRIVTENAVAIALAAQDLALADHSIGSMEDDPGQDWQQPLRQLVVKAKAIDPAPVTITAFHACVADGACTPIHQTAKWRLRGHNYAEEPSYSHCRNSPSDTPVTCIDWEQAWAYCRWQKKRLPVLTYLRYLASDSKEPATKIAEWTTSPECPLQPAPACTSKRQSIYSRIPDRHLIRPPRAPQPDQDANTASATTKDRYESVGFRCAPPWPVE